MMLTAVYTQKVRTLLNFLTFYLSSTVMKIAVYRVKDSIVKSVTSKGKQSTRDLILHALKSSAQSNIESLADAADVSPITVRHHLNSLQAEGLIEVESVRRKVGRPYYVYSLTEKGNELFPKIF